MSRQREVPQFINIEDKIAFQLTAKQLGWVALGAFFSFLAWVMFENTYFIIITVVIFFLVLALLFLKPYGQSLPVFLQNAFIYIFKPKVYIWKRGFQDNPEKQLDKKRVVKTEEKKHKIEIQDLKKVVKALDIYE